MLCESLIISECHDAYKFVVNSMFEMAPKALRENVYIVSADGILDQSFIRNELNLPNAHYIYDHWHLVNKVLPKIFGISKFLEMKNDITSMIMARTQYDFEVFKARVNQYVISNASMKHKFNLFITKKQQYAYYIIKRLRCNLNMTGSTPAEQNHSSVKRHLGKEYYESVDCMIRDLLRRHNFHALQRTRKLTEQKQRLLFLNNGICNITNPQHKIASSNIICLEDFNMWEKEHVHATKLLTSKDINGDVKVSLNGTTSEMIIIDTNDICPIKWCLGYTHHI